MKTRAAILRTVLLGLAGSLAVWGILQNPHYQEWRLSRMPLAALERESIQDPDDARLLYYTGLRLNAQGRSAEALPLLLRSARLEPDSARTRDALAQAQLVGGQADQAYAQLAQFAGTHPRSAEGHLYLGKYYLSVNAGRKAQDELERAVALDPHLADGWAALVSALSQYSGDNAAILDAARHAVALRPDSPDDQWQLATLLAAQGQPEARAEYAHAVALAPGRADIRAAQAAFLLTTGRSEDRASAEAGARRATGLDPQNALAWRALGEALTGRGADADAVVPLSRAAALDPYDVRTPRDLSQLSQRLGRAAEAGHWRQVALTRQAYLDERHRLQDAALDHPQDRSQSRRFAAFLARHGETDEAVRFQALAQGRPPTDPAVLAAVAHDLHAGGFRQTGSLAIASVSHTP